MTIFFLIVGFIVDSTLIVQAISRLAKFNGGKILQSTVNPQGLGILDMYWRNSGSNYEPARASKGVQLLEISTCSTTTISIRPQTTPNKYFNELHV